MNIKITESREGVFADVIIDKENDRAYKLFKGSGHPRRKGSNMHPDEKCRKVFAAELAAYKIIDNSPRLKKHAAEFFGKKIFETIFDQYGNDISAYYLLDCCYCMGLVGGVCSKIGVWNNSTYPYIAEFEYQMHREGIHFTRDSGIFNPESSGNFILIDFATHDEVSV